MITIDSCDWSAPGRSPFTGEIPAAVAHYREIPPAVRVQLREKMKRHAYDDVVEIRRDSITGKHQYTDLRSMHFGNTLCRNVSRAKWSDAALERGLVYTVGKYSVILPTVCSNLSLVTRRPPAERAAPPAPPAETPPEIVFEPPGAIVPALIELPPVVDLTPPAPTFEGGGPPIWWPPVYVFLPPVGPYVPPVVIPPSPAIPEPSTWALIVAGVVAVAARRRFT